MGFLACADAPNGPLAPPPLPAAGDHAALADWFAERGIQVLRRKLSDGADNPTLPLYRAGRRLPDAEGTGTGGGGPQGRTRRAALILPQEEGSTADTS